jgi:hypothetical protein
VARFSLNQKANLVGRPPVPTEAYLNRHNAVLDSSELTLSKLVAKVLRLEKLGKLALSSLNAVRAEQADKDETDRHMEVGEERDAQVKNILRSLEKFEAVCSMIHTATSAKACEPLVKQVRNKKKRRKTASPIKLSTTYQLSTIDCPIKLTPFRSFLFLLLSRFETYRTQRREDCALLLGPVGEILGLTKLRALALTSRVERLDAKISNATEGLKGAETVR